MGSASEAMEEWEMEKLCEERAWEGVLWAVRAREQEVAFLGEMAEARGLLRDEDLPEEVRSSLGAALRSHPNLDIRLLAARRREASEEGRGALTEAMRAFL